MLRWLFNKLGSNKLDQNARPSSSTPESQLEARNAVERAEIRLEQVTSRTEEVDVLVGKLQYQKDRNHFAELIQASMRGQ